MPRNEITVGIDDSPSGRAALRWAAQYALTSGSPLRAIHVLDWPYSVSSAGPEDIPPATMDEIESAYRTNITNVFNQIDPRPGCSVELPRGGPGPVLVRESKGAQLLVVGTREHVGLGRLLVGSYTAGQSLMLCVSGSSVASRTPGADRIHSRTWPSVER
jgi:nucleotide-binding universal stress UspA family protein